MEPWSTIHAVAIEERELGIPELGRAVDEDFTKRRALKKRKCRRTVQFDVHDAPCSIEDAVDEPDAARVIEEHAVAGAVAERDVPLVAIPAGRPPLARRFARLRPP